MNLPHLVVSLSSPLTNPELMFWKVVYDRLPRSALFLCSLFRVRLFEYLLVTFPSCCRVGLKPQAFLFRFFLGSLSLPLIWCGDLTDLRAPSFSSNGF